MGEVKKLEKVAEVEALLFAYGEPLEVKKVAKLLGLEDRACENILTDLADELNQNPHRGLTLTRLKDKVQLATKPELVSISQKILEEEFKEELSPAALETLSIIAYLGPMQRSLIDYIRGVNSSFTLRSLLMRGLITRTPNPKKVNVFDYTVSFDFLKHMGLTRIEELPEYEKYKDILKKFEVQITNQ